MNKPLNCSLYFTSGSSDKEYHISLEEDNNGWVVNFKYGRRGNANNAGTKTPSPVSYESALDVYNKLVNEKVRKGYVPDTSGAVFQ